MNMNIITFINKSFKTSMSFLLITCMLSLLVGCVFSAVEMQFGLDISSVRGSATLRTLSEVAAATSGVCILVLSLFYLFIRLFLHVGAVLLELAFDCAWIVAEGAVLVAAVVSAFNDELRHLTAFCFVLFTAQNRRMSDALKESNGASLDLLETAGSKNCGRKRRFYSRLAAAKKIALLSATTAPFSKLDRFCCFFARLLSEIVASPRTFLVRRKLRRRSVRFASENFVCPVPRCQMTDAEMEAMHSSKNDNQTLLSAEKSDQSFEDWQSHGEFDTGVRCKLGGSRDIFTEEYFFVNANGELEHPAHWKCFYREIYPFLSKEDWIPGFSSWEAYEAHIHLYQDFYETCIMWHDNHFKGLGRKRFRFAPEDCLLTFCPVKHMDDMSDKEYAARYNTHHEIDKMGREQALEQRFEIFGNHEDNNNLLNFALKGDTALVMMEEMFFVNEKGERRHPAHWQQFYNEDFWMMQTGQMELVPGFLSWDDYQTYLYAYDEYYKSSIERKVQTVVEEEQEENLVTADIDDDDKENEEVPVIEEDGQLVQVVPQSLPSRRGPEKKLKTFGPCNRTRPYLARKCKENVRYSK